jgi:hypothetical protein
MNLRIRDFSGPNHESVYRHVYGASLDLGTDVSSLHTLIICVATIHRSRILSHVIVRDGR